MRTPLVGGTLIRHDVIRNIPGGMEGKPTGTNSLAQGIFLDDEATDIVVLPEVTGQPFWRLAMPSTLRRRAVSGSKIFDSTRWPAAYGQAPIDPLPVYWITFSALTKTD